MENITPTYNWAGFISAYWWGLLITAAFAYLLGSVNFAIIFSSIARRRDIRKYGSGNAGATNVLRTFGPVLGGCTFVCDVLMWLAAVAAAETPVAPRLRGVMTSWRSFQKRSCSGVQSICCLNLKISFGYKKFHEDIT